jgi:drug/metabolite transporter (DMT)-like permease
MLGALLGLLAAISYGASDFCAGLAARRAPLRAIMPVAQIASLLCCLLGAWAFGADTVRIDDLFWGAASGTIGALGLTGLYWALAAGPMAVAAPAAALCAIIVPFLAGLAFGERPGWLPMGGVALALVSVGLIGIGDRAPPAGHAVLRHLVLTIAILGGLAMGLFYVGLAQAAKAAGLWPLVAAHIATSLIFGAILLGRPAAALGRHDLALAIGCGIGDALGLGLYVLAIRHGPLGIIAPLASLYPASTILLARVALAERINPVQGIGLGAAALAVTLMAAD